MSKLFCRSANAFTSLASVGLPEEYDRRLRKSHVFSTDSSDENMLKFYSKVLYSIRYCRLDGSLLSVAAVFNESELDRIREAVYSSEFIRKDVDLSFTGLVNSVGEVSSSPYLRFLDEYMTAMRLRSESYILILKSCYESLPSLIIDQVAACEDFLKKMFTPDQRKMIDWLTETYGGTFFSTRWAYRISDGLYKSTRGGVTLSEQEWLLLRAIDENLKVFIHSRDFVDYLDRLIIS